ncbi:GH36-type glycosyl hydrolase domain-containing protein [Photobacterium rosenbergii]|uniref:GH36-type glycosyl hydrolase domain-containing protein n=1 Tax=Photobacterium rosenbergii TaxID=294936 RepID=UPI001C99F2BD|nr:cellobiose phosphorylase [Photobacterium rosenbergii]MBY5944502.1 cellobiose phosphorylase [Photobacterium rosenbergii]
MLYSVSNQRHRIENSHLALEFNANNTLHAIRAGSVMVTQFETPATEKAISNIFLRIKGDGGYSVTPILFFNNDIETFKFEDDRIGWKTTTEEWVATVIASVSPTSPQYFYTVNVEAKGETPLTYDLVYGQDVALADDGAVKTNEAYCCQYLDHEVFNTDDAGYVVCSRQNLPQSTGNPLIQFGSFSPVVSYSTDGYQFFGTEYKVNEQLPVLQQPQLANEKYQYEMGYIALQTAEVTLAKGQSENTVFYGVYQGNCPNANVKQPLALETVKQAYVETDFAGAELVALDNVDKFNSGVIVGEPLSTVELERFFCAPNARRFNDEKDGELLSFFYGENHYVTLQEKEKHLERATGHVVASGNNHDCNQPIMSSTHHIFGVFNSQLTLGNTSFNKLLGVNRNSLNQFKHSGQRIWVKEGDRFNVLAMPSAYEVGLNFSRWIYKYQAGYIVVTSFSSAASPAIQLNITTENLAQPLEVVVSHQLVFGNNENTGKVNVAHSEKGFVVNGDDELIAAKSPELQFTITPSAELAEAELITDEETGSVQYLLLKGKVESTAQISFGGVFNDADTQGEVLDFAAETANYQDNQNALVNDFAIKFSHNEESGQKLNDVMQWFSHNALVHYSTPHGLEQYSGAAWGTRDVSQGPFEFFMAMHEYTKVEDLLKTIYSHQYQETGTWPQWFMFDNYATIQQEEAHGDIVVWPLKALADYITATGNVEILETQLPFTSIDKQFGFTDETFTLFQHVQRQVKHIIDNLVPDTFLSCYGDGDWDDTLQPANQSLRENMVSGWTIPLTLQAMKTMTTALSGNSHYAEFVGQLIELTENMERDYHAYLIKDETIAGFIHFARDEQGDVEEIEYLLHPADKKTGIKHRLLPASRSIISETFSPEMAESHLAMIEDKLVYPDGVRLMDKMAEYKAGQQTYFKRAELAANLGREVGLQYCHAHIRFIEALCKMGRAKSVFDNLFKIVPMGIESSVPNAALRQSNAYFSSSDARFNDRYQAYGAMDKVMNGEVEVKGGWRIYSSGPGIYINQVIASVLGIRYDQQDLILDPVIDRDQGEVTLEFRLYGRPVNIVIQPYQGEYTPKSIELNGETLPFELESNRYRTGGAVISSNLLKDKLLETNNTLIVTL